ncbi:ArsR/SmtB family transcription factor [Rhodococcus tukisamuensis]|uniref:Helix-turn-helix domain-containing protein n=1 Tax=Rhodococcus tukisamuensis TaxID=168276 RepID=A0A1G7CH78_9NOCA|nr:metalloregulator ArsR/SmtB family transcription factor [Rhodococcus tukisamuensis]SDE38687.1 Helix-turn-helix domain-containing protein [Rhodococcus tukisamuensis]
MRVGESPTVSPTAVFAVLADDTRWGILELLGREDLSASALADRLPVSRQAIAKHLAALEAAGLVERVPVGREVRYRALGAVLSAVGRRLESIGAQWDARLAEIKRIAESL